MSPSIEQFENRMGRDIEKGDVLIGGESISSDTFTTIDSFYEITDTDKKTTIKPLVLIENGKITMNWLRPMLVNAVEISKITKHGIIYDTKDIVAKTSNRWTGIIRKEDRKEEILA